MNEEIIVNEENLSVTLRKSEFEGRDVSYFRNYGLRWNNHGEITINVRQLEKDALKILLTNMYPNLRNWSSDYTTPVFNSLTKIYDEFKTGFDKVASERVPFYNRLYEHQKDGVRFQCYRDYVLCSFEQGLGKTVTSIVPSLILNTDVTIIICPASLKYNWKEELTKMWGIPEEEITILGTRRKTVSTKEKYVIINYDILEKFFDYLISKAGKKVRIILDECQYIKNRESKRTRVVKSLVARLKAKVTFLSGTPAPNKIIDIFSYLEISKHPYAENYKTFLRNFTESYEGKYGLVIKSGRNLDMLSKGIRNFMIRRLKEDCLDLPAKNYIKINFENDEYDAQYKELYEQLIQKIQRERRKSIDIQSQLNTLQILTSKAKVKPAIELAENICSDYTTYKGKEMKKKVAIMCNFREPLQMLKNHFKERCVIIDGSVDSDRRMDIVNRFKQDENCQVFLGQTTAAGVGLNLTECADVIFLNFPYTRAEIEQAADRFHRIGQENQVTVYFTVLVGKIDELIYEIIVRKYKDISKLIDNEIDNTETVDVTEEFIAMFGGREEQDAIDIEHIEVPISTTQELPLNIEEVKPKSNIVEFKF